MSKEAIHKSFVYIFHFIATHMSKSPMCFVMSKSSMCFVIKDSQIYYVH